MNSEKAKQYIINHVEKDGDTCQYYIHESEAFEAVSIAEESIKQKAIAAFKQNCVNLEQGNCRLSHDCDKYTRLIRFIELLNIEM